MDDAFLLRFLRTKKFDQERAFNQVMTYYRMRKENPDVYENLTPQRVRHILDAGVTGVLKDRAPDGSRIIVFSPGMNFLSLKCKLEVYLWPSLDHITCFLKDRHSDRLPGMLLILCGGLTCNYFSVSSLQLGKENSESDKPTATVLRLC